MDDHNVTAYENAAVNTTKRHRRQAAIFIMFVRKSKGTTEKHSCRGNVEHRELIIIHFVDLSGPNPARSE